MDYSKFYFRHNGETEWKPMFNSYELYKYNNHNFKKESYFRAILLLGFELFIVIFLSFLFATEEHLNQLSQPTCSIQNNEPSYKSNNITKQIKISPKSQRRFKL